jgi:hypothetical protein
MIIPPWTPKVSHRLAWGRNRASVLRSRASDCLSHGTACLCQLLTADVVKFGNSNSDNILACPTVNQTFLLADPFWLRKITTAPHILAHVNIVSGW